MSKEERIEGRKAFNETLAMLLESAPPDYIDGVKRAMKDFLGGEINSDLLTLSDEEASSFESSIINYGEFKGLPYKDVPIERLTWYADQSLQLQAYLRSTRGRKRIDDERDRILAHF